MTEKICPICTTALTAEFVTKNDWNEYDCPVCGHYVLSRTAEVNLKSSPVDYRFSAWIREHQEFGRERPRITTHLIDDIVKNLPNYKPLEKQIILLRSIERKTRFPGFEVMLYLVKDFPLAWAANEAEFSYLLKALEERGLIKQTFVGGSERQVAIVILPEGWDYLDKQVSSPAFTNQVFVATSFDKTLEAVWENGIKKAIERAGYKPYRIDKEPHIDRIDAKIIADIRDSLFIVADVTQQKQGVYFEAGYALALNRPVIWCVNKKHLKKVHFDTRQFNHIVWETPEDLQEQLYDVICVVIGKRKSSQEGD